MREKPLLHARHEYGRELQSLCRMKGHERDIAVRLLRFVDIGDERDLRKEVLKPVCPLLCAVLEVLCNADKLAQILKAVTVILLGIVLKGGSIARLFNDVLDNLMQGPCSELSHVGKDERSKILKLKFHLCREL